MDKHEAAEAVLEDVIDRLVLENGPEIAALGWRILNDTKESLENSGEDSPNPE